MRSQKEGLTYTEPTFVRNSNSPVRIFSRIAGMTVTTGEGELGLSGERVNLGGDDNYTDYCEGEPSMFWPPTVRSGRLQLRPLPSAGVTQLHRYYGPLRHPTRPGPVSRELPVDPYCDHRWGFPCCVWSPMRTCHRHYPGRFNEACSLVYLHCQRPSPCNSKVGSCNCIFGACSAFTHVTACTLAESPSDPLHRRLRQLRCLHCRFDCYRVERTSSRPGVTPAAV